MAQLMLLILPLKVKPGSLFVAVVLWPVDSNVTAFQVVGGFEIRTPHAKSGLALRDKMGWSCGGIYFFAFGSTSFMGFLQGQGQ